MITFTAAERIATAILKARKIITRPTSTHKNPYHQTEHSATETTVSHPHQCIYHLKFVRLHPFTITHESIESEGVTQEHQNLAVTQPCVTACRLDCNEKAPGIVSFQKVIKKTCFCKISKASATDMIEVIKLRMKSSALFHVHVVLSKACRTQIGSNFSNFSRYKKYTQSHLFPVL